MKRNFLTDLAFGAVVTGMVMISGASSATVLDFDDLTGISHAALPAGYGGVAWDTNVADYWGTNLGEWRYWSDNYSYSTPHSGSTYLFNAFGPANLGFTFSSPVNSVDAWFAHVNVDADTEAVELIGFVGNVPTYFSSQLQLTDTPQNLSVTGAGITRVVVHGINVENTFGGWYSMDDLRFDGGPAPVPEPSTIVFVGTGLAGLGAVRRRAKR